MTAILIAIWNFLSALGPLLEDFGGLLIGIFAALWELTKITAFVTLIVAAIELVFDPKGKQRVGNLVYNLTAGAFGTILKILAELTPQLAGVMKGMADAITANAATIGAPFKAPAAELAKVSFNTMVSTLTGAISFLPEDAPVMVENALGTAFGLGAESHAVSVAFESLLPEKLNTLNAAGPLLASMADFEGLAAAVREPLYKNAFGVNLDYLYKSTFKPELADEADAVTWHSRRLMSPEDLREVFKYSGLKAKYEAAYVASAYRSVQPRAIASMIADIPFPEVEMKDLLEFAGLRDADRDLLLKLLKYNSTKNVRLQFLSALERSVELGTDTPATLDTRMTEMDFSDDAKHWVQLTVAERKLQQLAELYRKSVSEAYRYGQVSDANYVSSLEAIGIEQADAEAHYAIDSIAKQGKALIAEQKAAARLLAQQRSAATRAAIEEFRIGTLDEAALEAALLAAGVDPAIASFAVVVQSARKTGPKVFVYGIELSRGAALQLREKVAALAKQSTAQLLTYDQALNQLQALGVPLANAQALTAAWFATTTAPARVGVKEPI